MDDLFANTPYYWQPSNASSVDIDPLTGEFQTINNVVSQEGYNLVSLIRQQQRHRFAMFFIREKFLSTVNPNDQYYRVRKYVRVPANIVELALETNLDRRRCDYDFIMQTKIGEHLPNTFVIFIVCVVTWDVYSDIIYTTKNSDYFIEYVCHVEQQYVCRVEQPILKPRKPSRNAIKKRKRLAKLQNYASKKITMLNQFG